MPNLQHWLNAWIKVNTKQQGEPSTAVSTSSNNRHHASFSGNGNNSNKHHHVNGHGHDAVAHTAGRTADSGGQATSTLMMKEHTTSSNNNNNNKIHGGSLTPLTASIQSTSITNSNSSGETRRPYRDGPSSGTTMPRPIDPELLAIRKFNSRKHKRRLNRTNSFSDLLRERAHQHQSALRTERVEHTTNTHHHHHHVEDSERRRQGHSSNIHHHPLDHDPHHHYIPTPPPPPTLHHRPVVFPLSQDSKQQRQQQQYYSDDSTHSTSPTETATTVLRSNLQKQQLLQQQQLRSNLHYNDETEEDHYSLESSHSALFGVADFFGTEITDIDHAPHPPSSARRRHRTQMKTAQHGLGDEQPHYLRSHEQYLVPPQQQQSQQQSQVEIDVQEPPISSAPVSSTHSNNNHLGHNNFTYNNTTTNNNNRNDGYSSHATTRQNKQYTQPLTNNHARSHNSKGTVRNHTSQSSRYSANGYHNSQFPARYPETTTTTSTSQRLLPGQSAALSRHMHITEFDAATTTADTLSSSTSASNKAPGIVVGGVRLPFFTHSNNTNNKTDNKTDSNSQQQNAFGGKANCPGCKVAQAELQHTQESLEYMRDMAIRKEYKCPTCKITNSNGADHSSSNGSVGQPKKTHPVLKNSSQQLAAVTERHKKQVEQLMKERNHWQRTMHIKLEKLASLCEHLNTESSLRSEESRTLPEALEKIKAERDDMAGEIEQLKATVKVYEKEREEHRQVQEKMLEYENHGLRQAQEAIAKRDETIAKLSARLETTLDTLALEREQQRQRRQIFFPQRQNFYQTNNNHGDAQPNNHLSASPVATSSSSNSSEQEELKRLRTELLESQRKLKLAQTEALQRENALRFRCESLQKQLDNREASSPDGSNSRKTAFSVELHPLSEKDGWESC